MTMRLYKKLCSIGLVLVFILCSSLTQAQADLCAGVGAGTTLTVNTNCVNTAYNVSSAFGTEIAAPSCSPSFRDGWFRFTTTATQTIATITATTNRDLTIAVYTGACGSMVEVSCIDAAGSSGTETLNMGVLPSTTYYIRLIRMNNAAANNMTGNICVTMPPAPTTTCSTTSLDNGGAGNYPANTNYTVTYCPTSAGQCITAAFTAFNTESGYDLLSIYNGNSVFSPSMTAPLSGTTVPGPFVATNSSGCLTFHFTSDGSTQRPGWSANITCNACGTPTPQTAQDCFGSNTVCNDASFVGNSSGSGTDSDLNALNAGCLTDGEVQSSWYYFSPTSSGTFSLNITPSDLTDDYDFAIWGPQTVLLCPPATPPVRCSYALTPGITGLNAASGAETSEGSGGDGFVGEIAAVAGQKYILMVNNYTGSSAPFTLDWAFGGGASLNCLVLPVQLLEFNAAQAGNRVKLWWSTASEISNNYFTIEKSLDGQNFFALNTVPGAGTVSGMHTYESFDNNPSAGTNYYRLSQTDYDGKTISFNVVPVTFDGSVNTLVMEVYPVPAKEVVHLQFTEEIGAGTAVRLMDITGRTLLSETLASENGHSATLSLAGLSKGVYFVVAENKTLKRKSALRKIVVE